MKFLSRRLRAAIPMDSPRFLSVLYVLCGSTEFSELVATAGSSAFAQYTLTTLTSFNGTNGRAPAAGHFEMQCFKIGIIPVGRWR